MKTESFPVRSCRKSFDPYPPLPERFGSIETDPDTVRPLKKRQCPLGEDKPLKSDDACIVCEVSEEGASSCCGVDCLLRFHEECLTPEFGGSEDLSNPLCPYCWFRVVALKSKSLREEAVSAENAVYKYLDKDTVSGQGLQGGDRAECSSSKEDQFDNSSHQPEEGTDMEEEDKVIEDVVEASAEDGERVDADHDESAQVQTNEEDVSEHVASQPNTLRAFSFFNKNRRLLWTPEEEEMLRMGVKKFAAEANKNIPWRKILEMGQTVFQPTRTPADLKDKWRRQH
ncbi:unnamed protein product [Brassica oleracea]